jgi:predicted amino acid racemase
MKQIEICLDISKINANLEKIAERVDKVVVVTKCLDLTNELIKGLYLGDDFVYDTRLGNLKLLQESKKKLLLHYPLYKLVGDQTSRVIVSTARELEDAARENVQSIYINFDLGDGKEGFLIEQKEDVLSSLRSAASYDGEFVLMSNIGCFRSEGPSLAYFAKLSELKNYFMSGGVTISYLSVGGSNCLPFMIRKGNEFAGDEIRVGEALLLGSIQHSSDNCGLEQNTTFLKTNIIERIGALIDIGYTHIDQSCISEGSGIELGFQSSDKSSLILSEGAVQRAIVNGDILIPLNYKGAARLSFVKDVKYSFI